MPKSTLTGGRWVTIEHEHVYVKGSAIVAGHIPSDTSKSTKSDVDKWVEAGHASRLFRPDNEVRETNHSYLLAGKYHEIVNQHEKYAKVYKSREDLSDQDRRTIDKVNGKYSNYEEENKNLRLHGSDSSPEAGSNAAVMQKAVVNSPVVEKDIVLHRHFTHNPEHSIGEEVKTAGFLSSSTVSQRAFMIGGHPNQNFGYEIAVPKGSKGVMFGQAPDVHEGTFSHGSRFKVLGKKNLQYNMGGSTQTRTIYQLAYLGPGNS